MWARIKSLSNLPEGWLILCILLVAWPHFSRMPVWLILLLFLLLAYRLACTLKPALRPGMLVRVALVILIIILCVNHYGTVFGKSAGSVFLLLLMATKLLESFARRDFMLLVSLSYFVIVTNFLFSQSLPTMLLMLVTVIMLVMAQLLINQGRAPLDHLMRFKRAIRLVLQAAPMMLVMFILFPRISGPLWLIPEDSQSATSGLSDTMMPGRIANLIQSNRVAFRSEFDTPVPAHDQLYWRAIVLWYFDGIAWQRGKPHPRVKRHMQHRGAETHYRITLEPHNQTWLFALDMPAAAPDGTLFTGNYEIAARKEVHALMQYELSSYLDYTIEPRISDWEKSAGLDLPVNNPRTRDLARRWRSESANDIAIVQRAMRYFHDQPFSYTLHPPQTLSEDPVDEFLFTTRRGFCEHFASSFTVLMRQAGIPARIVLGFQGGTINPVNQVLTVTYADAHAWSEVWLAGRGWVRVDPTAAVAPERIETSLDSALDENEVRPFHMRLDVGFIRKLRFYWDAVDNRWQQWVIGYRKQQQQALLSQLLGDDVKIKDMLVLMMATLTVVTLATLIFMFRPSRKTPRPPADQLYDKFCNRLARAGLPRESHEDPLMYQRRARAQWPQAATEIDTITRFYTDIVYRSLSSERRVETMRRCLGSMKIERREN